MPTGRRARRGAGRRPRAPDATRDGARATRPDPAPDATPYANCTPGGENVAIAYDQRNATTAT